MPISSGPLMVPGQASLKQPPTSRILHKLCRTLGLNLTQFTQYDENTWTEVHNVKLRNYVVEKMPEKLGYNLNNRERGHSPEDIYQMALNKVATGFPAELSPAPKSLVSTTITSADG
jgi:hypothetical protein